MSHTQGKWSFESIPLLSNEGQRFIMASDKRVALIDCQSPFPRGTGHKSDCAERDANAQLIAAAPELLAAAKRARDLLQPELVKEPDRTIFWELVAAIAKAEGRS